MQVNTSPSLRMLLAGTLLTQAEAKRFEKVLSGKRHWLPMAVFIFTGLLTLGTVPAITVQQTAWYEEVTAGLLLTACFSAALFSFIRLWRFPRQLRKKQWELYAADAKNRSPRRIEVYDDRVVEITARHQKVIYFKHVKTAVETADGFVISNGFTCMILRAADMIPFDVIAFRTLLQQTVSPHFRFQKEPARPQLTVPLPIPKTESLQGPEWICGINKPYCETALYRSVLKKRVLLLLPLAGAAVVLWAMVFCTMMEESVFTLTFLFYLALLTAFFAALLLYLLVFPGEKYDRMGAKIKFVFTADGVITQFLGNAQFCPKERIAFEKVKHGVAVRFEKETLLIIPDNEWQTFITLDKQHSTNE